MDIMSDTHTENTPNTETTPPAGDDQANGSAQNAPKTGGNTPESDALGADGLKALRAERKRANEAEKRVKELAARIEEFEDAGRSETERRERELEKAKAQIEALEKAKAQAERDVLVAEVANAYSLPPELAGRLQGDTREDLEDDAKTLAALAGPKRMAPNPFMGESDKPRSNPERLADVFKAAFEKA